MDESAAIALLDKFLKATDRYMKRGKFDDDRPIQAALHIQYPAVLAIAKAVSSADAAEIERMRRGGAWLGVERAVQRVKGALQSSREVAAILGPRGPQLAAASLHSGVWGSAASLWDGGHRREAVQAAATQVDLAIQAKAGRPDLSGVKLVSDVFSLDPPKPGRPRLRFLGYDDGSADWTSAHEGVLALGRACMSGIRNLTTHRLDQPEEQLALEYLATLSVLARWVDQMVRLYVEPPPGA